MHVSIIHDSRLQQNIWHEEKSGRSAYQTRWKMVYVFVQQSEDFSWTMHLIYGNHHNEGLTSCTFRRQLKRGKEIKIKIAHLLRRDDNRHPNGTNAPSISSKKIDNNWAVNQRALHRIDQLMNWILSFETPKWPAIDQCRGDMKLLGREDAAEIFVVRPAFASESRTWRFVCTICIRLGKGLVSGRAGSIQSKPRLFQSLRQWRTRDL